MILFAGELSAVFKVLFGEIGPADVTIKWMNEGSKRIRQLFDEAEAIGPWLSSSTRPSITSVGAMSAPVGHTPRTERSSVSSSSTSLPTTDP